MLPDYNKLNNIGFNYISHDNNMVVIRYILSIYVLYSHTATLAGFSLPFSGYTYIAVGGFFTLSGFLLFASFQKKPSLRHYVSRRARRILPPYTFIVLLAALSLCFVSNLSFGEYFTNKGFWEYLAANLSFLNFIHPTLPGVFEQNIEPAVNGSLWTMKGEWVCYLSIPVICLFLTTLKGKMRNIAIAVMILLSVGIEHLLYYFGEETGKTIFPLFAKQFGGLVVFFLFGALLNLLLNHFYRYHWYYFAGAAAILLLNFNIPLFYTLFLPMASSILVIWFSMIGKWGHHLGKHDNISYDIYLFHYPIIQLGVSLGLNNLLPGWGFLTIVLLTTLVLGFLSWNLIGKRFMKQ